MRNLPRFQSTETIHPFETQPSLEPLEALHSIANQMGSIAIQERKKLRDDQLRAIEQQSGTDIAAQSEKLRTEAELKFANPVEQQGYYNAQMASYGDQYINSLPKEARTYASRVFQNSALSAQVGFDHKILQQQKINEAISYQNQQSQDRDSMSAMFTQNNENGARQAFQRIINRAEISAKNGVITDRQLFAEKNAAQRQYQSDKFLHDVNLHAMQGVSQAEKYIVSMQKKGIPGFDASEVLTLANKARAQLKVQQEANGINSGLIDRNYKIALSDAMNKGVFDKNAIQAYTQIHADKTDLVNADLNRNLLTHSYVQKIVETPLHLQNAEFGKLKDEVDSVQFNQIQRNVDNANKQIAHDPYDYFQANPAVVQAAVRQSEIMQGIQQEEAESSAAQLLQSNPLQANLMAQRMHGLSANQLRVMSRQDAAAVVQKVTMSDAGDKLATLQDFLNAYKTPEERVIASRNLSAAGLAPNVMMVMSAVTRPGIGGEKQTLANWLSSNQKDVNKLAPEVSGAKNYNNILTASVMQNLQDFTASLDNHPGDVTEDKLSVMQQVKNYANYLVANKGQSISAAAKQAANTLVNDNFNYPTIGAHLVQVKKSVPLRELHLAFKLKLREAMRSALKVPKSYRIVYPTLSNKELRQQYINDKVKNGYLLSDSAQQSGTLVDSDGHAILVTGEKDPAFTINYAELQNPDSELSKKVIEESQRIRRSRFTSISQQLGADVDERYEEPASLEHVTSKINEALERHADAARTLQDMAFKAKQQGRGAEFNKKLTELRQLQELQTTSPTELGMEIGTGEQAQEQVQALSDEDN